MSRKRDRKKNKNKKDSCDHNDGKKDPGHLNEDVRMSVWSEEGEAIRRRTFPGPSDADELLRIAFTRDAYAEILAHAKESLDADICGVMVGDLCEDDEGLFVDVKGGIRGAGTKSGGTHVTYTQETWEEVYKVRRRSIRSCVSWGGTIRIPVSVWNFLKWIFSFSRIFSRAGHSLHW